MADTMRGDFSEEICSDCGTKECCFKHWGPLVPPGAMGQFCLNCWQDRIKTSDQGEKPKPLGYKLSQENAVKITV